MMRACVLVAITLLVKANVILEEGQSSNMSTETSSTLTTSTFTTTSYTRTTTSTSTTGPHVFGSSVTEQTFIGWLSVWRAKYEVGVHNAGLSEPRESLMPAALKGLPTEVVVSEGGVAGGIVTEGMGYGIMVEGFLAYKGDRTALQHGLSLAKSWLAMVDGPRGLEHPLAGGMDASMSATDVDTWPYGVSVVAKSHLKLGPSGVAAWKFPINVSDAENIASNMGSATDGDQDAILGLVYLAAALDYPADFVDMVVRAIISFASADIGFPDLYRELPDGTIVYVPKLGSQWGGLTPPQGKYKTSQQPWCYSPGYFAPGHYRTFRDFLKKHWQEDFNEYLPPLQGYQTSLDLLLQAFDSAVTSGYNILYYSSCKSGSVANWVGVKAACEDESSLNCKGVPWKHTPWVGAEGGKCAQSGTEFGSFGADASRTVWRIAMDYVLYPDESTRAQIYDREGHPDDEVTFGARRYLNRIVVQYSSSAICDGGQPGSCMKYTTSPWELAFAYDTTPKFNASDVTCDSVPFAPESWWAGFMAYPTFTAFVAPYDEIGPAQMSQWMDTFASICNFSGVNMTDFEQGPKPKGDICLTSYFEAGQAVIATMIMSDMLVPLASDLAQDGKIGNSIVIMEESVRFGGAESERGSLSRIFFAVSALATVAMSATAWRSRYRWQVYSPLPL